MDFFAKESCHCQNTHVSWSSQHDVEYHRARVEEEPWMEMGHWPGSVHFAFVMMAWSKYTWENWDSDIFDKLFKGTADSEFNAKVGIQVMVFQCTALPQRKRSKRSGLVHHWFPIFPSPLQRRECVRHRDQEFAKCLNTSTPLKSLQHPTNKCTSQIGWRVPVNPEKK